MASANMNILNYYLDEKSLTARTIREDVYLFFSAIQAEIHYASGTIILQVQICLRVPIDITIFWVALYQGEFESIVENIRFSNQSDINEHNTFVKT